MKTNRTASKVLNFKSRLVVSLGLAIGLIIAQPVLSGEALSDEWKFSGSVYGWVPSISGESSSGGDFDIDFDTIIENLDFVIMAGFGANRGKWGFWTDVIYMDLEDDSNSSLTPILTLSNIELKAWIVTPTVTYRVAQTKQVSLDLLVGVRMLYLKAELEIDPLPKSSDSDTAWDGIIGVKGKIDLDKNWFLPFYFDVGTGETDLTWQAFAAIGYKFSKFDLIAGYRHLEWDFDDGDTFSGAFNDLKISGPIIGAKFSF